MPAHPDVHPAAITPACVRAIRAGRKTQLRVVAAEDASQCPLGSPGDLLWVQEPWAPASDGAAAIYQADSSAKTEAKVGWEPARTLSREHARVWLVIRRVRLERLQAISEDDIAAEGGMWREAAPEGEDERSGFARWWTSVHARPGTAWADNPLVWVVAFNPAAPSESS